MDGKLRDRHCWHYRCLKGRKSGSSENRPRENGCGEKSSWVKIVREILLLSLNDYTLAFPPLRKGGRKRKGERKAEQNKDEENKDEEKRE
jgi:hypothetical protein